MTPPELFAAPIRIGLIPVCRAVIAWRLPNRTLEEVSEPVSATPSQPKIGAKKG